MWNFRDASWASGDASRSSCSTSQLARVFTMVLTWLLERMDSSEASSNSKSSS